MCPKESAGLRWVRYSSRSVGIVKRNVAKKKVGERKKVLVQRIQFQVLQKVLRVWEAFA